MAQVDPLLPFFPELSRSSAILRFRAAPRDRATLAKTPNERTMASGAGAIRRIPVKIKPRGVFRLFLRLDLSSRARPGACRPERQRPFKKRREGGAHLGKAEL
jgi:hypothetical protein